MSAIQLHSAADIVARAVVDVAAASSTERRLILGRYLGIEPEDTLNSLLRMADSELVVEGTELRALEVDEALLIPYLVSGASTAGQNQGSQGFAARLRTEFSVADGPTNRRVLLILDSDPIETVRSATDDVAEVDRLSWNRLCLDVAALAEDHIADLAHALAHDLGERRGDVELLERFISFCTASWQSVASAGEALHTIGLYVGDPKASENPARLKNAAKWRHDLDRWTVPTEDLERRLERKLGRHAEGIAKVLNAVGPLGIDYTAFTLADLTPPPDAEPLRLRRPINVSGAKSAISHGGAIAIWLDSSDGDIAVRTTGDATARDLVEIRWADGVTTAEPVDTEGWSHHRVSHAGWRFGTLVVAQNGQVVDGVNVGCYCSEGTWFPVESNLIIDPLAGGFVVEAEPSGVAVGLEGGVLGPVSLELPDLGSDLPDEPIIGSATRQAESHDLPLILAGEDVPTDEDEADSGDFSSNASDVPQPSPVHAYLTSLRSNPDTEARVVGFNPGALDWPISVGGEVYRFAEQRIGRFDGLVVERLLLERPGVWASTASLGSDGKVQIGKDPLLERLSLESIDQSTLESFRLVRQELFSLLAQEGSTYALATGVARDEAFRYVQAYEALLASLPDSGRYQPEFDRLLLMDSVVDTATGERLIAPTNPITIGFYLAFSLAATDWSRQKPGEPLEADVMAIVPDFLLPMFLVGGSWYEATPTQPFLWRSFQPVRDHGSVRGDEGRLIAERLRFFLSVHPAYDDWRQELTISALEPGDGSALIDALRRFYRVDYAKEEYTRPRLDLHLCSAIGSVPPAIEDFLAGGDDEDKNDPLIRSRVRVSGHKVENQPSFSHLTFVFHTPSSRDPEPQEMSKRASSLYVGGLAARPGRFVEDGANERRFAWGTFADSSCGEIPAGRMGDLLPKIVKQTLALVGAQPRELFQPGVTRMATTAISREFMPKEYASSVWVVHLDHLIGLEAFAPDSSQQARYLIDYEDAPGATGLGGVTATAQIEPYKDALTQALQEVEKLTPEGLDRILRLLNAISGRWGLRLLRDNPERIRERIGTVAAIAVLDELDESFSREGGFGVLVPLDEVFDRLSELGISRPASRSADDLLHVWIPKDDKAVLGARVIEVKYRTRGGPELGEARQEIENTEARLAEVFNEGGPSRLFRARDLAGILRASMTRGSTFGLVSRVDLESLESAFQRIASGDYDLEFGFWIGGKRLIGDVISVELENRSDPVRSDLPGAGPNAGLIRVGRSVVQALARGRALEVPNEWETPRFEPPPDNEQRPSSAGGAPAPPRGEPPSPGTGSDSVEGGLPESVNAPSPEVVEEVRRLARELDGAVLKYGIELEPFQPELAQVGPSVIRFRARPLGRQSLEGVARRAADLGREIGASEGVLVSQEPYFITLDVPRKERQIIRFSDFAHLLGNPEPGALKFLVGMAASGEVTIADLARLPHLLIAGATGSGKSVFLRSLMCSLLEQHGALDLSILLVDPKQIDFLPFEDLPHLVDSRIFFDPGEAVATLGEMIDREVGRRRPVLKEAGATNILEYYEGGGSPQALSQIVVVVDEFADLASNLERGERAEFMSLIQRYGQLTRAFGIYLVLATQRPSVQVITGDIKANLTARVALKVQAPQDSVTILGHGGAEALRDKGDLLFEHAGKSERLQGFMVSPSDVAAAVARWSRP